MSRGATLIEWAVDVADIDRGMYADAKFRWSQHPSETDLYVVARVLAYCMSYQDDLIVRPGGVSTSEEPAFRWLDKHHQPALWIDVGLPSPQRLGKALRDSAAVEIYAHRDVDTWLVDLMRKPPRNLERCTLIRLDKAGLDVIASWLQRRNRWSLVVQERQVSVSDGERSHAFELQRQRLSS